MSFLIPIFWHICENKHVETFISVINQLDAQNFCFTISLFLASTCFEHMFLKHVEAWNKLIVIQKFYASSWLITGLNILKCTVNKTSKNVEHCCPSPVCMMQICCRLAILLQYYLFYSVPLALHVQVVGLVRCIAWKIWGITHVIQNNPKKTHKWQEDCLESLWSLSRGKWLACTRMCFC